MAQKNVFQLYRMSNTDRLPGKSSFLRNYMCENGDKKR